MDLSKESIYTSLFQFLTRSRKFQVWYEDHRTDSVVFSTHTEPLIHAVRGGGYHLVVRIKDDKVLVTDDKSGYSILESALDDPEMFPRLEDLFDIGSEDDPARPVDPMKAIADLLD